MQDFNLSNPSSEEIALKNIAAISSPAKSVGLQVDAVPMKLLNGKMRYVDRYIITTELDNFNPCSHIITGSKKMIAERKLQFNQNLIRTINCQESKLKTIVGDLSRANLFFMESDLFVADGVSVLKYVVRDLLGGAEFLYNGFVLKLRDDYFDIAKSYFGVMLCDAGHSNLNCSNQMNFLDLITEFDYMFEYKTEEVSKEELETQTIEFHTRSNEEVLDDNIDFEELEALEDTEFLDDLLNEEEDKILQFDKIIKELQNSKLRESLSGNVVIGLPTGLADSMKSLNDWAKICIKSSEMKPEYEQRMENVKEQLKLMKIKRKPHINNILEKSVDKILCVMKENDKMNTNFFSLAVCEKSNKLYSMRRVSNFMSISSNSIAKQFLCKIGLNTDVKEIIIQSGKTSTTPSSAIKRMRMNETRERKEEEKNELYKLFIEVKIKYKIQFPINNHEKLLGIENQIKTNSGLAIALEKIFEKIVPSKTYNGRVLEPIFTEELLQKMVS